MTIAQLADELIDAVFDANPLEATLLGFRDREDQLTDHTDAGDPAGLGVRGLWHGRVPCAGHTASSS